MPRRSVRTNRTPYAHKVLRRCTTARQCAPTRHETKHQNTANSRFCDRINDASKTKALRPKLFGIISREVRTLSRIIPNNFGAQQACHESPLRQSETSLRNSETSLSHFAATLSRCKTPLRGFETSRPRCKTTETRCKPKIYGATAGTISK